MFGGGGRRECGDGGRWGRDREWGGSNSEISKELCSRMTVPLGLDLALSREGKVIYFSMQHAVQFGGGGGGCVGRGGGRGRGGGTVLTGTPNRVRRVSQY